MSAVGADGGVGAGGVSSKYVSRPSLNVYNQGKNKPCWAFLWLVWRERINKCRMNK